MVSSEVVSIGTIYNNFTVSTDLDAKLPVLYTLTVYCLIMKLVHIDLPRIILVNLIFKIGLYVLIKMQSDFH